MAESAYESNSTEGIKCTEMIAEKSSDMSMLFVNLQARTKMKDTAVLTLSCDTVIHNQRTYLLSSPWLQPESEVNVSHWYRNNSKNEVLGKV